MLQCVRTCLYISFELQDFFLFRSRLSQSVTVPFSVTSIYGSVNRLVLYILLWALFWDIWTIISCVFNPIYIASIASLFQFLFRDIWTFLRVHRWFVLCGNSCEWGHPILNFIQWFPLPFLFQPAPSSILLSWNTWPCGCSIHHTQNFTDQALQVNTCTVLVTRSK